MRELEFSKITLRLVHKDDPKDSSEENTVAKLTGDTLPTLQRILVRSPKVVTVVPELTSRSTLPPSWFCAPTLVR